MRDTVIDKYDRTKCRKSDNALLILRNVTRGLCEKLCGFKEDCVGYVFRDADQRCSLRRQINKDCLKDQDGFTVPQPPDFDVSLYSPNIYGRNSLLIASFIFFYYIMEQCTYIHKVPLQFSGLRIWTGTVIIHWLIVS